ncbi:hypothetical protein [Allocoleopsis franciscana]|uniref:DUF1574 domain-containing protein n=1 Tax=Allocoleopsis franciscana PCC 7113 TaxID=1173027 RepID=K9WPI1_9CYAN|nr:hypothetical protein [Allocoleopsis franciscana]AFZ21716.1 hypothetical protein Mic7113_6122 [Allocoleopsis franciscana PCC 7113]
MANFCLKLHGAATLALLTFTSGCSSLSVPETLAKKTSLSARDSTTRSVVSQQSPSNCLRIDPFTKGVDKAIRAATLSQSAKSKQDWELVGSSWVQAIGAMQAVSPDSPKRAFAQKKVIEYLQYLDVALQKASTATSLLPFPSFDNPIFDDQLLLYLSYISAVGQPDVLIVGSSRALVGIDPQQLQQALAAQGKGNLKVFNFGVNGGTAQIVDFQLRQLLKSEQLPRLILWADGVRAFNSGRPDRTYNSMVASGGYQRLMAGERPTLPQNATETTETCEDLPGTSLSNISPQPLQPANRSALAMATSGQGRTGVRFEATSYSVPTPDEKLVLTQLDESTAPSRLTMARNITGYSSWAIKANGFLPLDIRFDPRSYYQKKPRVSGRYDADYQPFNLAGQQAIALNSVKAMAKQQQIPLVFVNLPLNQDYLDSVRRLREQQFQQMMQKQAGDGLVFIDMGRQWPNRNEYFSDPSHLNRYGAAAVANQLANNPQIPWPQPR